MPTVAESTTWSGVGGSVLKVRLSHTHGEVMCSIFHIPTNEVELGGGAAVWGPYDTAHLCCGHTFNACALALHFLSNTMTCPVCRAGPHEAMCPETVPVNVRRLFAGMQPETRVVSGISLNFDRNDIASEVRLLVESDPPFPPLRLSTPLRGILDTGRAANMQVHETHRSFQRFFNTFVESTSMDAMVCIAIHHPLLDVPLRSEPVSVHSLTMERQVDIQDSIAIAYTQKVDGLTRLTVEVHIELLFDVIVHCILQRIVEGQ